MGKWADDFFMQWQAAWSSDTDAVLGFVTPDVEYWDVTLDEPIRGRDAYAEYVDGFFKAFTEIEWSQREPPVEEGRRVAETWRLQAVNSGPLWIGLPATGRALDVMGTDIFEFRDGLIMREHSYYDVAASLRQLGMLPTAGSPAARAVFGAAGLGLRARRLIPGLR